MKQVCLTSKVRGSKRALENRCLIFEVQLKHGGVAQLGEHLLCKQGVIGSIPFISTTLWQERAMKPFTGS